MPDTASRPQLLPGANVIINPYRFAAGSSYPEPNFRLLDFTGASPLSEQITDTDCSLVSGATVSSGYLATVAETGYLVTDSALAGLSAGHSYSFLIGVKTGTLAAQYHYLFGRDNFGFYSRHANAAYNWGIYAGAIRSADQALAANTNYALCVVMNGTNTYLFRNGSLVKTHTGVVANYGASTLLEYVGRYPSVPAPAAKFTRVYAWDYALTQAQAEAATTALIPAL